MRRSAFLEVFTDSTGGNPKLQTSGYSSQGEFPIIDQGRAEIAGYSNDASLLARVQSPVIVFGDHTRIVKYVDYPFILGADGTKVLRSKNGENPRYLYHYLRSLNIPNAGYSRHYKFLKEVSIPLPSLDEQRRIAAILDAADDLRVKRREVLAKLDTLSQSVFNDLFGDSLASTQTVVADAGRVQLGRQRAPKYQTGEHTRPYMRVANVQLDRIDTRDVLTMDFDDNDLASYRLSPGDILLNEGQSTELVGRPAMWRGEIDDCCFQNTLIRFTCDESKALPEYAFGVFLHYFRDGSFSRVSSKTSNVAHLGASRFAGMPFPIPDLGLQRKYAHRVKAVDILKQQSRVQLTELDTLFASLQHRAFSGEL